MLAPAIFVSAKIAAERLGAPRHLRGGNDRGERARRAIAIGIAQGNRKRAVAAHGMAHYGLPPRIDRKVRRNDTRQLRCHVAPHAEVMGERVLCRVDIETGAEAKIVSAVWIARYTFTARTRVGGDEDNAVLRAGSAKLAFL